MATTQQPYYPVLEVAIESAVNFFQQHLRKYKAARELRDLGASEVSAIARDLGITPVQLRLVVSGDAGFPKPLNDMLSVLRIDDRKLQGANSSLARDMQLVCTFCANQRRCRRELRAGSAAEHFRDYCPNSANFDAIMTPRDTLCTHPS